MFKFFTHCQRKAAQKKFARQICSEHSHISHEVDEEKSNIIFRNHVGGEVILLSNWDIDIRELEDMYLCEEIVRNSPYWARKKMKIFTLSNHIKNAEDFLASSKFLRLLIHMGQEL